MCIRDRRCIFEHQSAKKRNDVIRFENMSARDESKQHRPKGCLLYTSDAADDLPCVDLGGRRIIKKKNKKNKKN